MLDVSSFHPISIEVGTLPNVVFVNIDVDTTSIGKT